jgi:hypothetical protein
MKHLLLLCLSLMAEAAGADHLVVREGRYVRMILLSSEASTVQFASSLDGFVTHELITTDGKTWEVRLPAQESFHYFYLLDGQPWTPDCACRASDDYGSENCVYDPGM